jgi:hypothetical protein
MAASATLALKAGVWFRRGLLLMISPVRGYHRRYQAETPLIGLELLLPLIDLRAFRPGAAMLLATEVYSQDAVEIPIL